MEKLYKGFNKCQDKFLETAICMEEYGYTLETDYGQANMMMDASRRNRDIDDKRSYPIVLTDNHIVELYNLRNSYLRLDHELTNEEQAEVYELEGALMAEITAIGRKVCKLFNYDGGNEAIVYPEATEIDGGVMSVYEGVYGEDPVKVVAVGNWYRNSPTGSAYKYTFLICEKMEDAEELFDMAPALTPEVGEVS